MRVTTDEAAALTGVSAATIRRWVAAGHLSPIQPEARHWLFDDADVTACQYRADGEGRQCGELQRTYLAHLLSR
ncbi:MAG: helix-turn-helix domain-containing protein [Nocardioidaceae bacterium]